jgi:hypothetical protein
MPVALIVLAALAVAYAYLLDRTPVSDAERAERRRMVFPRFVVGDVARLEVERAGVRLVAERAPDAGAAAWVLRSPHAEPADPAAVEALLQEMSLAVRLREVSPAQAAGLDAPRAQGEVDVGALAYRFALGAPAPVPEGASYMRVDGEGTFVVGKSLAAELLQGADAYRERVLFPYGARDVGRLEVHAGSGSSAEGFVLQRSGASFRLEDGTRAARRIVEPMFGALAEARAHSFLPDGDADRSVTAAALPLTVVAEPREAGRPRVELRVGGACPDDGADVVVVSLSPGRRSACASKVAFEPLRAGRGDLADPAPFYARVDEVAELRLESAGPSGPVLDLARRGAGWHQRAPRDRDLAGPDADAASALAERLTTLRAVEVRSPVRGEPARARSKATLVRTDGVTEVVGVEEGGLVRREDDGATLRMSDDAVRDLERRSIP